MRVRHTLLLRTRRTYSLVHMQVVARDHVSCNTIHACRICMTDAPQLRTRLFAPTVVIGGVLSLRMWRGPVVLAALHCGACKHTAGVAGNVCATAPSLKPCLCLCPLQQL